MTLLLVEPLFLRFSEISTSILRALGNNQEGKSNLNIQHIYYLEELLFSENSFGECTTNKLR